MKTAQETFDTVVTHLAGMTRPSAAIMKFGMNNTKLNCYYRSPEGEKCAIGVLIDDDEYTDKIETVPAVALPNKYVSHKLVKFIENYAYNDNMLGLLNALQEAHDDINSWTQEDRYTLKQRLATVAYEHNVSSDIIERVNFVPITPLDI
jgi:hypothetical protein